MLSNKNRINFNTNTRVCVFWLCVCMCVLLGGGGAVTQQVGRATIAEQSGLNLLARTHNAPFLELMTRFLAVHFGDFLN